MQSSIALVLLAILATSSAFSLNARLNVPTMSRVSSSSSSRSALFMAEAEPEPEFQPEDPKLFDMNRITRLGRSRDQVFILRSPVFSLHPLF
jgi:hypothetical protein